MDAFTDNYNSSYNDVIPDHREKIKHALCNVCLPGLIRFWAPVKRTTTSEHSMLLVYRLCCIDNLNKLKKVDDDSEEMMLISGPPANAILNHLPEVVLDLSVYKGNPLVDSALKCGFTCSLFLPVFIYQTTSFIGIVECSTTLASDLVLFFSRLKMALVIVGLNTFNAQECQPDKTIGRLKCAKDEIEKALEIVSESHDLALAQVWINYETENHVSKFAIKLTGYSADSDIDYDSSSAIKAYYDACDMFPLKLGEGPAGKTLQTSEPLFCRNINQLTDNGLLGLLPANNEYSFLAICLRSIHTGDLNYAFEFLWPRTRDYLVVLESLLATLKRCLPSFTFSFGAKIGDQLCLLDVEKSLNALELRKKWVIKKCISSLNVNCKTTPIPSPRAGNKILATTMEGAAGNHYEWQGRNFMKRKLSDFCGSETESTGESSASSINCYTSPASNSDIDTLIIKAEYEGDLIVFHLPLASASLAALRKEIDEGFDLNESYRLRYLHFTKRWILMVCDENIIDSSISVDTNRIRLKVVPLRSLKNGSLGFVCS